MNDVNIIKPLGVLAIVLDSTALSTESGKLREQVSQGLGGEEEERWERV